jgi:hypothetical protein
METEEPDDAVLAERILLLISTDTELKEIFKEATDWVSDGRMTPADFRDLARYAAFRMGTE